jgi:hypothetical protein
VDISSSAFGIQEENHFPQLVHEMMPGMAEIRKGYMYGSGQPGLGIDINENLVAKYSIQEGRNGGAYGTERTIDDTVIILESKLDADAVVVRRNFHARLRSCGYEVAQRIIITRRLVANPNSARRVTEYVPFVCREEE